MENMPPDLRAKYDQLRAVIDPISQKPVSECLGSSYWGLTAFDTGARRFNFENGDIASYDHTNRYPIVCVYGPIYKYYDSVGGPSRSPFGRPLTDVRDLPNGSRCAVFEGGHIHQWGDKAEPFPASHCAAPWQPPPPPFPFGIGPNKMSLPLLQKWIEVSYQRDPVTQKTIAECLGSIYWEPKDIETGGQVVVFDQGQIVVFDQAAAVVYGSINKLYGGVDSGWGRPLADEQDLGDGGRCSVFEGGHIHRYANQARPVRPEMCTARFKPTARPGVRFNKMPPLFQWKWSQLLYVNTPTNDPVATAMGDIYGDVADFPNDIGGQYVPFSEGILATLSNNPVPPPPNTPLELIQPFVVYGKINDFWYHAGSAESKYGRPLCDEQQLPDGGRCGIFEGGHIHLYNGVAGDFPPHECQARYKPLAPPVRPSAQAIAAPAQAFLGSAQSYPQATQSPSSPSGGGMLSAASNTMHSFQDHFSQQPQTHSQTPPQSSSGPSAGGMFSAASGAMHHFSQQPQTYSQTPPQSSSGPSAGGMFSAASGAMHNIQDHFPQQPQAYSQTPPQSSSGPSAGGMFSAASGAMHTLQDHFPQQPQAYSQTPPQSSSGPSAGGMFSAASGAMHTLQDHFSQQQSQPQVYSLPTQSQSPSIPSAGAMLSPALHAAHSFAQPLHSLQHQFSQTGTNNYSPQPQMTADPVQPEGGFMSSVLPTGTKLDSETMKPVGAIALCIFALIGWNIEKDCDDCCCCCCC